VQRQTIARFNDFMRRLVHSRIVEPGVARQGDRPQEPRDSGRWQVVQSSESTKWRSATRNQSITVFAQPFGTVMPLDRLRGQRVHRSNGKW